MGMDMRSGEMVPIDDSAMEALRASCREVSERETEDLLRKQLEAQGVPRADQGPIFKIGDRVEIKGATFEVRGFEGGLLHLQGVPTGV